LHAVRDDAASQSQCVRKRGEGELAVLAECVMVCETRRCITSAVILIARLPPDHEKAPSIRMPILQARQVKSDTIT
jgi:hypothetical protein